MYTTTTATVPPAHIINLPFLVSHKLPMFYWDKKIERALTTAAVFSPIIVSVCVCLRICITYPCFPPFRARNCSPLSDMTRKFPSCLCCSKKTFCCCIFGRSETGAAKEEEEKPPTDRFPHHRPTTTTVIIFLSDRSFPFISRIKNTKKRERGGSRKLIGSFLFFPGGFSSPSILPIPIQTFGFFIYSTRRRFPQILRMNYSRGRRRFVSHSPKNATKI